MTLSLSWHHSPYSYKDFINIYSNTQLRNLKFKKKILAFRERDERERDSVCVCVIHVINYKKKKLKDGFVNKYNILSTMMNSFINLKEKEIYTKHFTGK